MTNEDILTLAKAGFTAQQIAALSAVQPKAEPAPTPAPAPAPEPAPTPAPAPAVPAPEPQTIEQVLAAVNGLNKNVQQALLAGSSQPGSPVETTEQILANIINPPVKE